MKNSYDKMTRLHEVQEGSILANYLTQLRKAATGKTFHEAQVLAEYKRCFPEYFTVADVENAVEISVQYCNRSADVQMTKYLFDERAEASLLETDSREEYALG